MGVDLGGTRIRTGAVTSDGRLFAQTESPTAPDRGSTDVVEALQQTIARLSVSVDTLTSIGVACAGALRSDTIRARESLRIERARLGDWAGVLGVAALAG